MQPLQRTRAAPKQFLDGRATRSLNMGARVTKSLHGGALGHQILGQGWPGDQVFEQGHSARLRRVPFKSFALPQGS